MKKFCFLICFVIAGCASKPPGGGHVVGNPLMPQQMAESCQCGVPGDCQCAEPKQKKKKEEGCTCSGHGK